MVHLCVYTWISHNVLSLNLIWFARYNIMQSYSDHGSSHCCHSSHNFKRVDNISSFSHELPHRYWRWRRRETKTMPDNATGVPSTEEVPRQWIGNKQPLWSTSRHPHKPNWAKHHHLVQMTHALMQKTEHNLVQKLDLIQAQQKTISDTIDSHSAQLATNSLDLVSTPLTRARKFLRSSAPWATPSLSDSPAHLATCMLLQHNTSDVLQRLGLCKSYSLPRGMSGGNLCFKLLMCCQTREFTLTSSLCKKSGAFPKENLKPMASWLPMTPMCSCTMRWATTGL